MKAVFIDASPKRKDSTSGVLLNALESRLPAGVEVVRLGLHAGEVPAEVPEAPIEKAPAAGATTPFAALARAGVNVEMGLNYCGGDGDFWESATRSHTNTIP